MKNNTKTEFISVEICIKTNHDCDEFIQWFEKDNYVEKIAWDSHKWFVYFAPTANKNADITIQNLCKEIKKWPKKVKAQWDQAEIREFYAGYRLGDAKEFLWTQL